MDKQYSNRDFLSFFQSRLTDLGAESALKYRRTLSELDCFLSGHKLELSGLSGQMVADWTVELLRQGLARNTVLRHLNILSSLVRAASKKGMISADDAPRAIAKKLSEQAYGLPVLMDETHFRNCLAIIRDAMKDTGIHTPAVDLLLFSLLNGAAPLAKIAALRKTDAADYRDAAGFIIERNLSPKRAFVFDLRQSYRTPRQIHSAISESLSSIFNDIFPQGNPDPDSLVRSIWAACALRCGAIASEALACVDGDAPYAVPEFCSPGPSPSDGRRQLISSVNSALTSEMPRWHAMHLRRGVKFDELRKEILEQIVPAPELFYPCETIRRRIGKRSVVEEHPFISRTVFFKIRPDGVLPMFHKIGDKAWCYRLSSSPDSPYASISQSDMRRFQAAVGIFTPDIEIHPLGELSPEPGESVIIVMAGYGNREGKIEDIINKDSGSAIFRVKLSTDMGYEWRIDVDVRQIQRIINS